MTLKPHPQKPAIPMPDAMEHLPNERTIYQMSELREHNHATYSTMTLRTSTTEPTEPKRWPDLSLHCGISPVTVTVTT